MGSKKKSAMMDKNSSEYREKREKNNNAVKRSRDKSKAKAVEAQVRVQKLQTENEYLRSTVDNMTTELKYLKEMLISQAGAVEYLSPQMEQELEELLREDAPTDVEKISTILVEMKRLQSLHQGGGGADYLMSGVAHGNPGYHAQQPSDVYQPNGNLYDQTIASGHGTNLHY
ncbi:unnamed protein product [Orchesella dallaii]|uniref:BZIP domain-containing protein n=1 Tax=Orchesella dallaii TaxID=48710 RepID=A0ABP1RNJ0_9HEXA